MTSEILQLTVGSRDLSQVEKKIAERIHKMTTVFIQNIPVVNLLRW